MSNLKQYRDSAQAQASKASMLKDGLIGALLICLVVFLVACDGAEELPPVPVTAAAETARQVETAPIVVESGGGAAVTESGGDSAEIPTLAPAPTETPVPSPTPRAVAATVNGVSIFQDEFDARLAQFQNWYPNGTPDGSDLAEFTLSNMVTQILLEQTAEQNGIVVSAETVQNAIDQAIADSGGDEGYQVWLSQSGHNEESFRLQVTDEILAQAVVGFVTRDVPISADYVRARYIQIDDFATAQAVLTDLQAGGDFATLVDIYSVEPSKDTTRGDLGFFRRGTLFVPVIEDAAFGLAPEAISDILTHTRTDGSLTYYIVQTVEVQLGRKLSQKEYSEALQETFEAWLTDRRAGAAVETFVNN